MFGNIATWCWGALFAGMGDAADVRGLTPSSGAEALRFMATPKVTQAQAFGQPLGRAPPISGHEKILPHLSDEDAILGFRSYAETAWNGTRRKSFRSVLV